jgi:hypothetical protein
MDTERKPKEEEAVWSPLSTEETNRKSHTKYVHQIVHSNCSLLKPLCHSYCSLFLIKITVIHLFLAKSTVSFILFLVETTVCTHTFVVLASTILICSYGFCAFFLEERVRTCRDPRKSTQTFFEGFNGLLWVSFTFHKHWKPRTNELILHSCETQKGHALSPTLTTHIHKHTHTHTHTTTTAIYSCTNTLTHTHPRSWPRIRLG